MNGFPQFNLAGQVALVTGAARGLGRAISLALANAGADVAIGLRDIKADSGLVNEIKTLDRRVLPLQMDVTKLDQVFRAVDDSVKHFGRLDILVNNAGCHLRIPHREAHRSARIPRAGVHTDRRGSERAANRRYRPAGPILGPR